MLTQQEIQNRASSYGCCSLESLYAYVQNKIYGDGQCAEENWNMFLFLRWAQSKMCDPCWTVAQKTELAKRVDCFCDPCGCEEYEEPTDCTITPDFFADEQVDELPEDPDPEVTYYVTGEEPFIYTFVPDEEEEDPEED
jgi:hypothetical protein